MLESFGIFLNLKSIPYVSTRLSIVIGFFFFLVAVIVVGFVWRFNMYLQTRQHENSFNRPAILNYVTFSCCCSFILRIRTIAYAHIYAKQQQKINLFKVYDTSAYYTLFHGNSKTTNWTKIQIYTVYTWNIGKTM